MIDQSQLESGVVQGFDPFRGREEEAVHRLQRCHAHRGQRGGSEPHSALPLLRKPLRVPRRGLIAELLLPIDGCLEPNPTVASLFLVVRPGAPSSVLVMGLEEMNLFNKNILMTYILLESETFFRGQIIVVNGTII